MKPIVYTEYDLESAKILNDFLPEKLFDSHAHVFDHRFMPARFKDPAKEVYNLTAETYAEDMKVLVSGRPIRMNMIVFPSVGQKHKENGMRALMDSFLVEQLNNHPEHVGEIMVFPDETAEDIEKRLVHPGIRGLKCYHVNADMDVTFQADIGDFLPESAWEVANKHKLPITLHMVKDKSLADPDNMKYICEMAKRYPDAILILAHAARAFASWTGVENVEKIAHLENVWYDFAGVCESPAMFMIMKKTGTDRCMWGSDYDVCRPQGKVFSLGDGFYWLYEKDIANFQSATKISYGLVGTENLMATRQACIMADLTPAQVENVFYNNAARLFG